MNPATTLSSTDLAPPVEGSTVRVTAAPPPPARPPVDMLPLRRLMWIYLALWIFEGALRKWFLPGLASPLLIVRDPFLLLMYAIALQKGVFPRSAFIPWIAGIGIFALIMSIVGTSAPLLVELYGLRADYLHLPLIFLMPVVFNRDDVRLVGKWVLILAVPMSLLVFLQFASNPNSRFNAGAGGGENGGMLESAYGHIRPSGTFSFTNGLSDFTAVVVAFFLYHLMAQRIYPRLLWLATMPALLILVALSGSRGVVGIVIVVLLTVLVISGLQMRYLPASLKLIGVGALMFIGVGSFAVFKQGLAVFAYRFGDATNVKVGFVDRFFMGFLTPFETMGNVPFFGVGLGMGTSVGSGLIQNGARGFLYAEGEMGRVIIEGGPIVGVAFLLLRLSIVLCLLFNALRSLRKESHVLPMLLLSACVTEMFTGQFGQATTLGYVTIACGLCLAANRPGASEVADEAAVAARESFPPPPRPPRPAALPGTSEASARPLAPVTMPAAPPPSTPPRRGRSLYAEQLHRQMEEESKPQNAEGKIPDPENKPAE